MDDNGIYNNYEYRPFGAEFSENHDERYQYTGKEYEDSLGLYYYNARFYDPQIGRFISEDPAQQKTNWYIYSANNPMKYVDRDGEWFDTFLDVVSIVVSVKDVVADPLKLTNWVALGVDVVCLALPGATGGGTAVKAANKAEDLYDTAKAIDKGKDAVKTAGNVIEGTGKSIFKVGSKSDALQLLKGLPDDVAANVKRFIKKSGSGYTEYGVELLENGNYQVKMLKPGDVSGHAEYYKIIDKTGKTLEIFKDTYDNSGKFVHRKYK